MDIVCPECKTEYEFDERHVTSAGVSVQCTNCGFTFKVRRREVLEVDTGAKSVVQAGSAAEQRPWLIRCQSGELLRFRELATLQSWIIERRVSTNDEISRTGDTWKQLGAIPELSAFFQAAQARAANESAVLPEGVRSADESQLSLGTIDDVLVDEPAFARDEGGLSSTGRSAAWERPGGLRMSTSGPYTPVDLDDEIRRKGGGKFFFLALLSLGLVALGGAFVLRPATLGNFIRGLFTSEAPSEAAYAKARELFLRDDRANLDAADGELARLTQQGPLIRAARAEIYTVWAQHLLDGAELLTRRAKRLESHAQELLARARATAQGKPKRRGTRDDGKNDDPVQPAPAELQARSETLRLAALELQRRAQAFQHEAVERINVASAQLDAAQGAQIERAELSRAAADLHRLQNKADVLELLGQVRRTKPDDAEAHYVEGLFRVGRGDLKQGIAALRTSVAEMRAQYKQLLLRSATTQALIHLRQGQYDEATEQVTAVLQVNAQHNWAKDLREQIAIEAESSGAQLERVAAEVLEASAAVREGSATDAGAQAQRSPRAQDAASATPAPSPSVQQTAPAVASAGATSDTPAASRTPEPPRSPPATPRADYGELVRAGNRAMEHGQTMRALDAFERALKLQPRGVEALTGIGYAQLDLQRFTAAMSRFQQAVGLSPSYGDAMIGMAEAYLAMGNKVRALESYRAYLVTHAGGPKAALARRNVSDLERELGDQLAPGSAQPPTNAPSNAGAPDNAASADAGGGAATEQAPASPGEGAGGAMETLPSDEPGGGEAPENE